MIVNSYNQEFGYELLSAVPYSYELYLKGELEGTISGKGSEALYYFSPKHEINPDARSWFNTPLARVKGLPYTDIHLPEQPEKKFPPYKEHYKNTEFKWKKPTLCICNRYNIEWSYKAINFFDLNMLDWMFTNLKNKYEIVYFPVSLPKDLQDQEQPIKLEDIPLAKEHGIKVFTDFKGDWNTNLMKVFANCDHYITMNGGYSILASMFSGTNIIYSVPGEIETKELKQNSFFRWYPNINNVRTLHVPSFLDLQIKIGSLYIKEEPCLNILIRTFRPNYLKRCLSSLECDYENVNIVLICDQGSKFTRRYKARCIEVQKKEEGKKPNGISYGSFFPYNRYIDEVQRKVTGFILVLDDDDELKPDAIDTIMANVERDKVLFWKCDFKELGIIPKEFGKITLFDVTSSGFCYHSDYVDYTDWSEWKRADYRTAKKLTDKIEPKFLDEVLSGLQDCQGFGTKGDLPDEDQNIRVKLIYPDMVVEQTFGKREFDEFKNIFIAQGICIELMK